MCKLCNEEVETLEHFILKCILLQEIRNQCIKLQWLSPENYKNILKTVLLFQIDEQYNCKYYINIKQAPLEEKRIINKK